ncbi:putative serine/threonine protein kinase KKQ8 [Saccharomyces eubayanus]|uniref:putative serine/threonine protein kinase KKQ8 n=1 Tax=Saccharomyces eubayanus TaxID=1080349 RepID=UPI0006C2C9C9|nr:KKQ8-like protein [Saccharomyces eubayanus]KOG98166.1 KKQ8-like protein [Saccharomyces eubayanus]
MTAQDGREHQGLADRRARSFSESFKCLFKPSRSRGASPSNVTRLPYRSSSSSPKRNSEPPRRSTISAQLDPKAPSVWQHTYTLRRCSPGMPKLFKHAGSDASNSPTRRRSRSNKKEEAKNESPGSFGSTSNDFRGTQGLRSRSSSNSSCDGSNGTTTSSESHWAMDSLLDHSDNDVIPYRGSNKDVLNARDKVPDDFKDSYEEDALHRATSYPISLPPKQLYHEGLYTIRSHTDGESLKSLPRFAGADLTCIIEQDGFKVYEDGSHEHNVKVMEIVTKLEKSESLPVHRQGSLSKPKLGIALSGLFKHHKDECDIENALSLLPNENGSETNHKKQTTDQNCDKNGKGDSNSIPPTQNKKDYLKIVNPDASLGDDELKLINSLSSKIHTSLQHYLHEKNLKPAACAREEAPTFQESYGHPVGTVGAGAYGEVKVCARSRTDSDIPPFQTYHDDKFIYYAVKELKPKTNNDLERFCTKITSEFIIGHSLSHYHKNGQKPAPNILSVFDILESSSSFIEVMEFCPAGDLYGMLVDKSKSKGRLHPLEADCFMKQLLHGVKFMHDHGIAHCDLKPENILFYPHGLLKICDFGTSSVFQTAWERRVHTQKGIIGSEPYMAPEEFVNGEYYDPRLIDCWSCGVVYVSMVLGHHLWKVASREKDISFDTFCKEMTRTKEFKVFEELKHVNSELAATRKIALYCIFQWEPKKRISIDKLLGMQWMKHTNCCLIYESS